MSRSIEKDWVDSIVISDIADPFKPKVTEPKAHVMDSAWELKHGLEVKELDTIPAELLDYFN